MNRTRLPNQTRTAATAWQRRRAWRNVLSRVFSCCLAATPALLLPVALVTRVEDKQIFPALLGALLLSTVSILILSRLFKSTITPVLDQHESPQ